MKQDFFVSEFVRPRRRTERNSVATRSVGNREAWRAQNAVINSVAVERTVEYETHWRGINDYDPLKDVPLTFHSRRPVVAITARSGTPCFLIKTPVEIIKTL